MNQKIPFHDLSARVAVATGISSESAEQFVKSFFDLLAEAVTSGESVRVKGLGSFNVVSTEGEKNIEFIPDKEITDVINAPFAIFEAVELDEKLSDEMLDEVDREARENNPTPQEQSTTIGNDEPEIGESEQHESGTQGQAEITDVEPNVRPEQIQEPKLEAEEIASDEDQAVEDEPTPSTTTIVEEETVVENEPENELDSSLAMTSNVEEELVSEETETRDN
ncbi:MAG: HU family DNA-binding protein, partial [Duncaniella sp.]|nr:HU family DNA-binding protein [Duncaniella sp.]